VGKAYHAGVGSVASVASQQDAGQATGEAEWCPEASSRGDAKQPRRRASRAGALTRGAGIFVPPGWDVSRTKKL
jgi:hypothetical protein